MESFLTYPSSAVITSLLRCSRYAFGPNRLHYCGPNASNQVYAYMNENIEDLGLRSILEKFKTLYPYLRHIAQANGIKDPFDPRVVEAYWVGNALLDTVPKKKFYHFLHK